MKKIFLIASSEYGRRVRSKVFVAITLLAPVLMLASILLPILVVTLSEDDTLRRVAVVDETGAPGLARDFTAALPDRFVRIGATPRDASEHDPDSLRARVLDGRLDGYFVLPAGLLDGTAPAVFYSRGGGGITGQETLRAALRETIRARRIRNAGASEEVLTLLDARAGLRLVTVSETGDAADGTLASSIVGYAMGLLVYVAVLIYGMLVMRGVIEEKASRIVEVMASSASPFELMMGKVLGIGAVGLTQLAAWGVLLVVLAAAAGPLVALFVDPAALAAQAAPSGLPGGEMIPADLPFDPATLPALITPGLVAAFVAFFLGGYLLYAALFAAVGSAVEQESDAQSLQIPVTIPVILPVLFLPYVLERPDSTLSVVLSLFPFASPVLMTVRMAVTDVPGWQVAAAFALLTASFVGVIWLAARIYRVGILMYGKKATMGDLWRWMRHA